MEPLAPHEKIFVDSDFMEDDEYHGSIACHECHGGNPKDANWRTAHKGVVKDPTYPNAEKACGGCHDELVGNYSRSLHKTVKPFYDMVSKRGNSDKSVQKKLMSATKTHCGSCHASCGQCHISRPDSVGGGLLEGHQFLKTPPMKQVCTACHGS